MKNIKQTQLMLLDNFIENLILKGEDQDVIDSWMNVKKELVKEIRDLTYNNKNENDSFIYNRKWESSDKLKEIKDALERKREEPFNVKNYIEQKLNNMMNKKQLTQLINNIAEYQTLSPEEKKELDWIENPLMVNVTKKEIFDSVKTTILEWEFYKVYYEKKEDFEMCTSIRNLIYMEIEDTMRILDVYLNITEEDEDKLNGMPNKLRKMVKDNYDYFLKVNTKK